MGASPHSDGKIRDIRFPAASIGASRDKDGVVRYPLTFERLIVEPPQKVPHVKTFAPPPQPAGAWRRRHGYGLSQPLRDASHRCASSGSMNSVRLASMTKPNSWRLSKNSSSRWNAAPATSTG